VAWNPEGVTVATAMSAHRRTPVVADVALFYGERSGGIRTYLDEKARHAATTGAFEHHVIVPGRRERHRGGRHEVRSLRLAASNGYRIPLGAGAVKEALRRIAPDFVVLHDPFWRPLGITQTAHALGAKVIAVHHASAALNAAGLPGPDALYLPLLRGIYRHAYESLDAVMSVVDTVGDSGRAATIPLRFGLHPAFRPGPVERGEHLLYVGRLSLEKHVDDLFAAAATLPGERPVLVVGDGPARGVLEARARRLGIAGRVEFQPFVSSRRELARIYREAACVVDPAPHETFGLVVLEAAASGARVVACSSTPSTLVAPGLVETYPAKDRRELAAAIERSLARPAHARSAAALADRLTWRSVFDAELRELEALRR
jgi:alpha-1,6-mannosyltransferase